MKKVLLVFFFTVAVMAQQSSPFRLSFDVSSFRGDQSSNYIELYYSFDVSKLTYQKADSAFRSEVIVSIIVKRSKDDSIVGYQAWRMPFSLRDTSLLTGSRTYFDLAGFMLKPDIYRIYISARDASNLSVSDSASFVYDLNPISGDQVMLSDIEFCSSILPSEKDSTNKFYKNTYEVKPNPSKLYGLHQPALFYYLEAYNLNTIIPDQYLTRTIVTNAVGKEVINHEKAKRRTYESSVEVGILKVHTLRSGVYTLTYSIIDTSNNKQYSTSKRFFIYNPSLPTDTLVAAHSGNIDATVFATLSEEEIDKEMQYIRYIANKEELDQYSKLKGVDAKRRALFQFWENRDEDPETPNNESRQEYLRRIEYANTQYRTGFRDGWRTDRGRVYIVYGPPDDIERHANETDTKPYEIWSYNSIQGGVIFVFGDRTGFSDYILLHSTHRNEIRDDNWQRQIQAN
ncbi:MAG: GWxTD domain-containing protein [Bacteroidota bacterium]|jgi:GWxTD domain-containing protein